ncbi:glycosyltransferase family 4 protein [Janthinobacterium sp. B9-8]|uniref:glycosyltransferase family 4 protein n=1 Tax=Janthinobacterium sp. B9-8 TaxID=1236179 RepID=UPI00061CF4F0|nr:glycosyltransferase family 4 protein [Janthinobacterium sp. B9-8]AMC36804.1 transferase [Janthinobacterium sp. B9-8]
MKRVLIVHNAYQQKGGEDSVVDNEIALLKKHGHEVEHYFRHNDEIINQSKLSLLKQTVWSKKTYTEFSLLLKRVKPDVIHVHNTFPLISPSLYWAAQALNVPLVQTLHNFRLLCPQATFLRDGRVCEDCVGHATWRGIMRRCYRDSFAQSAVLSGMLTIHRSVGTYKNKINRYIALNEFCKNKYIQGGIPADKIMIKPNFAEDVGCGAEQRSGFLYVGRLSPEKGARIFATAFSADPHGHLAVVGAGEESVYLTGIAQLDLCGALPQQEVRAYMRSSLALVLPSICYENMPMTLVEAYSSGLPVIASRLGPLCDLVEDGKTGLLFNASDADDLAKKMTWAVNNPEAMAEMGRNAREKYLAEYTPDKNYEILMNIYNEAINACPR